MASISQILGSCKVINNVRASPKDFGLRQRPDSPSHIAGWGAVLDQAPVYWAGFPGPRMAKRRPRFSLLEA